MSKNETPENDEEVMVIEAESPFKDKESLNLSSISQLQSLELKYRKLKVDVELAEIDRRIRIEKARDAYNVAYEKALLDIKDDYKERGLTTKELREGHAKLEASPKLVDVQNASIEDPSLTFKKQELATVQAHYNHYIRLERRERLEMLVKLLSDKKEILKLSELLG